MTARLRTTGMLGALTAVTVLAAGCGGSSGGSSSGSSASGSSSSSSSSAQAAASGSGAATGAIQLPANIKSAGVIKVASDASYPPVESKDSSGNIVGLDPDLGAALGKVLGVKFQFVNTGFDGIIPALQAGRFDIAMSAMTDNKQREAAVSFVDYFRAGTGMVVKKGNPKHIQGLSSLCGLSAAAEKGTIQVTQLQDQSKKCNGKSINVETFPDQNGANLALQTGRADVVLADYPVAVYASTQSSGNFQTLSVNYNTAPYGIAVPKGHDQLLKALQAALTKVIASGQYKTILAKYNVSSGAIAKPTINGATS